MDQLSPAELFERIDELIASFEQDENRFYVVIDIASQLRDELSQIITSDTSETD